MQATTEDEHDNVAHDPVETKEIGTGNAAKQECSKEILDCKKTKINKKKLPPSKSHVVKCFYCKKKFIHQNLKSHILAQHGSVPIREEGQKSLLDIFSARSSDKNDSSPQNININAAVNTEHIKIVDNTSKSHTKCDIDNFDNASSLNIDSNPQSVNIDTTEQVDYDFNLYNEDLKFIDDNRINIGKEIANNKCKRSHEGITEDEPWLKN